MSDLDGAGEMPAPGVEIDGPEEFAAKWNSMDQEERVGWLGSMQHNSRLARRCFIENHDGLLREVNGLQSQLWENYRDVYPLTQRYGWVIEP